MEVTQAMQDKLTHARRQLHKKMPLLSSMMYALEWKIEPLKGYYAQTDGLSVTLDPESFDHYTDEQLVGLLAHEVMHTMLLHPLRLAELRDSDPNYDHKNACQAESIVVTEILKQYGNGITVLEDKPSNARLYEDADGSFEKIYRMLLKNEPPPQNKNNGDSGLSGGDSGDGQQHPKQMSNIQPMKRGGVEEQAAKMKAAGAIAAGRMQGLISAGLDREFGEALKPKVNWREVLREFITKQKSVQRSYRRLNRHGLALGLIMPGKDDANSMGKVAVAIDCSGSVGEEELARFAAELTMICEDLNPEETHVLYFDSAVCGKADVFRRGDEVKVKPRGGGGTAFSPIFRYLADEQVEPVCCVVLTDMYCDDFGKAPEYPVLWVNVEGGYKNANPPFGLLLNID